MMMRDRHQVLVVTPWYPMPTNPASGVFIREHSLAAADFDDVAVVHLAGPHPSNGRRIVLERLPIEPLPTVRAWCRTSRGLGHFIQSVALRRAVRSLNRDGFRPQIIHAHVAPASVAGSLYARITRRPLVVTEHSSVYLEASPTTLDRPTALLTSWVLRQAAVVLPVGQRLCEAMRRIAPRARYEVLGEVVDCNSFSPGPYHPRSEVLRLVAVGLLSSTKNYELMLKAVQILIRSGTTVQLQIVGYGPDEANIREMILRYDLDTAVHLLGYVAKDDIPGLLRNADIFVHTSRYETFCAAVAEALASGLPVVCTRCGGPEDFVTPESGRIVDHSADAIASAITDIASRLETFDPVGIAESVRTKFSPETVGKRLHEIYTTILR